MSEDPDVPVMSLKIGDEVAGHRIVDIVRHEDKVHINYEETVRLAVDDMLDDLPIVTIEQLADGGIVFGPQDVTIRVGDPLDSRVVQQASMEDGAAVFVVRGSHSDLDADGTIPASNLHRAE